MSEQPGRPGRKRDSSRDAAILGATLDVLAETGYERMTTDMVAARASASKATLYRRWPSKADLVVEAVESLRAEPIADTPDTGSLAGDLAAMLDTSGNAAESRKFKVVVGLLSLLPQDADLANAVQRRILGPRSASIRVAVAREQARGGIGAERDPDLIALVVMATITYRLIMTGEPVDRRFLATLADGVLKG
ncbi:TetR/AcrR family transcriptional regulator [Nocardia sp. alder85J]|uniref:TetR/AcrR family transcriptional regulator n=1 Tax=Nocardia sp. alder85J TaxID=2862949 RepID=UPI001CD1BF01|nr:TetR/AcrR family transcriptional regulator [Nocardia sp. alder85J]MCX4091831.1 TetR/AcrR family transcriptional regulator [Nocardia sp. alder85J]